MGKKNKGRNRGSLGEDFEDSYEYDAEDDGYQDYGKKKNKRRNRDSNSGYDDYGYGDYDSDVDDGQDYDVYDHEEDEYDSNASGASSSLDSSDYERTESFRSGPSSQSSSTVSSSVFKESKPSPLGGMHPVRATPNANGFATRSTTGYDVAGSREDSAERREESFGFKRVSATPDFHPMKQQSESGARSQASEKSSSDGDQERYDELDSTPKKRGFSSFFSKRHDNEVNESRLDEKETIRERKAREKAERLDNKSNGSDAESADVSEEEQLKNIRIDEIRERLAKIDNDIREYRQFDSSDEDIREINSAIESLNAEKKDLVAELRRLGGYRMAFLSGFSTATMTASVKAVGKMISSPFNAFRRHEPEDGEEENEVSRDEDSSRDERGILRRERREARSKQREEKRRLREEKRESRRIARNQDSDFSRQVDESAGESDDDTPSSGGRRWVVLAHRTLGVTIVATVLLVGGYVGYMFLGHGNDKQGTVAEDKSAAGSEKTGRSSALSGKYASKTSIEDSETLISDASKSSDVSGNPAEKPGLWSRLKSKFSRKSNSSDLAKKSEKKKDNPKRKEDKLATLGKSASENLKKTTEGVKSKFDSFNEELMSESDALKNDLDEVGAIVSKKKDELGDALSDLTTSVSSQLTDAVDSVSDAASDLVDSGMDALDDFKTSTEDANEDWAETIPEASVSLGDSVESNDSIVVNDDPSTAAYQSEDGAGASSTSSSSSSDELIVANDEDGELNVDPEKARLLFGDAPVRTASTPATSASSEESTDIGVFPDENLATTISDEPETPVGAVWGVPDESNATSQTPSSALPADSPSLPQTTGDLVASNADSEVSSVGDMTSSRQNSNSFGNAPRLLNSNEVDVPPSLPTLSPSSTSDEGMTLIVADASEAALELNETSDMNDLSGAAPILKDDLETWNTTPSLTSQGSLSSDNSLTTSLNSLNSRVEDFADRLSEATDNVRGGVESSLDELGSALNDGVASLQNRGQQTLSSLNESLTGVKDAYNESVGNIEQSLGALTDTLDSARLSASDSLQNLGNNISDNFNALQDQFASSNTNALTATDPPSNTSTLPSSFSTSETQGIAAPSLSSTMGSVAPKTSSLEPNASTRQNLMSTTPRRNTVPSVSDALTSQTTPSQNALAAVPNNPASQAGAASNVETSVTVPSSSSVAGMVASDASDLVPESVDYAYSMSPLGRAGSGMRIDSSTIATPTVSGTTVVPSATSGGQATLGVGAIGATGTTGTAGTLNGYRQYVTKEGDNLLTIADRELGSSSRWGEIKRLNNLRSGATYFEAGTRLLLPPATVSGQ